LLERIDKYAGLSCTLNEWKFLLNSHYDLLYPFLKTTPRRAPVWCCPEQGRKLEVIPEGTGYTALSPDCEAQPELEVNNIPSDDLQMWEFCQPSLARKFCGSFGLQADPKPVGRGILRMGTLPHRAGRIPSFLLFCSEKNYLPLVKSTVADHSGNCLFYTPRYCPDTAVWLQQKQHGYFPLEDLVDVQTLEPSPAHRALLQSFISSLPPVSYQPIPGIRIAQDYYRIKFPDGYVIDLSRAYKRRSIVRFVVDWVRQSGSDIFDAEVVRESYNQQHPEQPWDSDRFREDLFKRNIVAFDRLFETLDAPNGRFRLKI